MSTSELKPISAAGHRLVRLDGPLRRHPPAPPKKAYWLSAIWCALCLLSVVPRWVFDGFSHIFPDAIFLMFYGLFPLLIVICMRIRCGTQGKQNSQVRLYPEGYGQRRGFGPAKLMHWMPLGELSVLHESLDIYRLEIERFGPSGGEDWAAKVSLYFRSDPVAATEIRSRLRQWRSDSRKA